MSALKISLATVVLAFTFMVMACTEDTTVGSETEEFIIPQSSASNIENIQRPLKSSSVGTGALISPGATGSAQRCNESALFTLITNGEGNSTHLGHFTFEATNCTPFPIPGPLTFTKGTSVLTAANGQDKLFVTYFGQQEQVDANLVAAFTIEQEITGGEGKFKDAKGKISGAGTVNFSTGISASEVTGYILYNASNRSYLLAE